ncbi:unnamed protein product [Meganyctiphanes norvegica]|uniref:MARVEL domain-containing protein n=1 Tax=Meganyctiphanes norvegica TaxID=48144 RepID=A0AAV2R9C6_MEGNR
MASFNSAYLKTPSGILKIVEILFVCIAFGIFRGATLATYGEVNADYFACGSLVLGLVITPLLLVCYLMGNTDIQKTIMELVLNFLLCVFLIAAGSKGANLWSPSYLGKIGQYRTNCLVMSSFTIMAGLAYGADTVLALMAYK